jgi:flagellar export protein FliJ|tara:strand:+ start:937 stop:1359 length:423 start_codon:yes stop_codon:yes gene_type:complete
LAKDLHSLIRLYKWQLDEKRRKLGELIQSLANLEDEARRLQQEHRDEQSIASASPNEAGFYYGKFVETAIQRRDRLGLAIVQAEQEVEAAREELSEAHQELKKFEITQSERNRREIEEEGRRAQTYLDEVGLQSYRQRRA